MSEISGGLFDPWMWLWVAQASEERGFLGPIMDKWLRDQLASQETLVPTFLLNITLPESRSWIQTVSEPIIFTRDDFVQEDLGVVELCVTNNCLLLISSYFVLGLKMRFLVTGRDPVERLLMPKVLAKNRYWRRTLHEKTGEKSLPVQKGDTFCLLTPDLIGRFVVENCKYTNGYLLQCFSIDAAIYRNVAKQRMLDPRMLISIANALRDDGTMWSHNPLFIAPIEAAVVDTVSVPVEGEVS